jgi:phosphoheptose isomerase
MTQLLQAIEESIATLRPLAGLEEPLNRAAKMVLACLTSGHKLLVCGNGGSASDATHLATEFLCRYRERPPALSGHFAHGQRRTHDRHQQRLPRR